MSGINPQKKLFETFRRPHILKNAEIAYTALRTGSEINLKLFLERGMLEWLIGAEYCTGSRTERDCGMIKAVSKSAIRHDELIVLMTNMMEVGDYGI